MLEFYIESAFRRRQLRQCPVGTYLGVGGLADWLRAAGYKRRPGQLVLRGLTQIPDTIRLPKPPPLELVVTGGSSAVKPIKDGLLEAVKRALEVRGTNPFVVEGTSLLHGGAKSVPTSGYSDVELAQLAVAVGASQHPKMTELKYYSTGL